MQLRLLIVDRDKAQSGFTLCSALLCGCSADACYDAQMQRRERPFIDKRYGTLILNADRGTDDSVVQKARG